MSVPPNVRRGYRFALAEIKTVLFVVLRNFTFSPLPGDPEVIKKGGVVLKPHVEGEEQAGTQLPLIVREL
jgi:hypothetical protein